MVVSITHWRPFDLLSRSKKKCYVKINQKVHATDLTVISFLDYFMKLKWTMKLKYSLKIWKHKTAKNQI